MSFYYPVLLQIFVILGTILVLSLMVGEYIGRVLQRLPTNLDFILDPLSDRIYPRIGVHSHQDQKWHDYFRAAIVLNLVGIIWVIALQRVQYYMPMNPQGFTAVPWLQAINTSISFATNADWQTYTPETSISPFVQMMGLTVQNFISAITGLTIAIALMRSFKTNQQIIYDRKHPNYEELTRYHAKHFGNFWVDAIRLTLWVFLPLCLLYGLIFIGLGVPQTFKILTAYTSLEGQAGNLITGPIASQEAIKILGTNGGGYFGANSAHPFENPSNITNFLQMVGMFVISAGLIDVFGRKINDRRHSFTLLLSLLFLLFMTLILGVLAVKFFPYGQNGLENRFGVFGSAFYSLLTTSSGCGANNTDLSALNPGIQCLLFFKMALGSIDFGGVGFGFYQLMVYVLLTVFLAGLMVGRTPEYLGKKIESQEIKYIVLIILIQPFLILSFTALSCLYGGLGNEPHMLSKILYTFISTVTHNGSSLGSFDAVSTPFFLNMTSAAMFISRYIIMYGILAIAGSFSVKLKAHKTNGTFPVHGLLFACLLIGVILITSGLVYFPVFCLTCITEVLS